MSLFAWMVLRMNRFCCPILFGSVLAIAGAGSFSDIGSDARKLNESTCWLLALSGHHDNDFMALPPAALFFPGAVTVHMNRPNLGLITDRTSARLALIRSVGPIRPSVEKPAVEPALFHGHMVAQQNGARNTPSAHPVPSTTAPRFGPNQTEAS